MAVIALILAIMMAVSYLKTCKSLFKSPKRTVREIKEAIEIVSKRDGEGTMQLSVLIVTVAFFLFTSVYYIITASVIGSLAMILVASLIVIRNLLNSLMIVMYAFRVSSDIKIGWSSSLSSFADIGYIISFFIMFFV